MIPAWVGLLAGTLAAKMGGNAARKGAAAKMYARAAERLGGHADMAEAIAAGNEIDAEEGAAIGKAGANFVKSSFDEGGFGADAPVVKSSTEADEEVPLAPAETTSSVAMFGGDDEDRDLLRLALRGSGYGRRLG